MGRGVVGPGGIWGRVQGVGSDHWGTRSHPWTGLWALKKCLLNGYLIVYTFFLPYYRSTFTVKDSDLNFFWAPKLSAGGLNFGLDSQYGNWNISSLNSPLRGILYSMVWRCNLRVVKVNIAFSCRSFMVRRLMFRFGLKFITANLLFMFNRMIVCVCQEHKP